MWFLLVIGQIEIHSGMLLYIVILGVLATVLYALLINRLKGLPPGPPPFPFIGNLLNADIDMDKKFVQWKKKYGRVFTIWMPHPVVVISDHKLLQDHIIKDGDKFAGRISQVRMNLIAGGAIGIVFNDNSIWKEQRKFALHALRQIGFTSTTIQNKIIEYSHEIIGRWKIHEGNNTPFDITIEIQIGVACITWQQIFGRTLSYDDPLIGHLSNIVREFVITAAHPAVMVLEFLPFIQHLDSFIGNPLKKHRDVIRSFLNLIDNEVEIIKQNICAEEEPRSFAEAFIIEMRKRVGKGEDLGTFTHEQLTASCSDMFLAGLETTVTTLRFAFHNMITHPEVQRKAQREIDEHIGKRDIQMDDQKSLHYCNAVIQEVQRLANAVTVNFARQVISPVNIDGYNIPAGTGIIPEFNIVHLDENEFVRPDYFCPERHIDENGAFIKDPRITPFSIGKRACLGEGLARMELFLFFTSFIQHLTFSSVSKVPPELNVQTAFTRSPAPFDVLVQSRD